MDLLDFSRPFVYSVSHFGLGASKSIEESWKKKFLHSSDAGCHGSTLATVISVLWGGAIWLVFGNRIYHGRILCSYYGGATIYDSYTFKSKYLDQIVLEDIRNGKTLNKCKAQKTICRYYH